MGDTGGWGTEKQAEYGKAIEAADSILPWSLLQLLPSGSCPHFLG